MRLTIDKSWALVTALTLAAVSVSPLFAGGQASEQAPLADQIESSNRELSSLRAEIKQYRNQIRELASEEKSAAEELRDLEHEMNLVQGLLNGLDEREAMLLVQSDSLRGQLALFEDDYAQQQARLAGRLRALYLQGPQRNLELILTADSFSSLVTRLKFASIMGQLDQQMMDRIRQDGLQIQDAQGRLREALASLWEAREEATQQRRRLENMDQERRAVLSALQSERQSAEANLEKLRLRQQRVTNLLEGLEQRRQASGGTGQSGQGGFADLAGTLEWPVAGEVLRGFGRSVHPEFKTVTLNNGINIAAARGSPVYAVGGGKVEFSDYLPGFGVCVILDHGDGYYSLYAHLERTFVSKGSMVATGEILAEVGEALHEGGSQLYFEIRQGKTPLDPRQWLKPRGR